jgi:hypothetical protein
VPFRRSISSSFSAEELAGRIVFFFLPLLRRRMLRPFAASLEGEEASFLLPGWSWELARCAR